MSEKSNNKNIRVVHLTEAYKKPELIEAKTTKGEYIVYGEKNNYYQELIDLYTSSPTNARCIAGISDMIFGGGIESTDRKDKPTEYLTMKKMFPNRELKKIVADLKLLGMGLAQVQYNKDKSKIIKIVHTPAQVWRAKKANSKGIVEGMYYHPDWPKARKNDKLKYVPMFGQGSDDDKLEIFCFRTYRPGFFYYAPPDYIGCLQYCELESEVSNYHINNIQNGLQPSLMINFNNGVPNDETQEQIERKIQEKFSGTSNSGKFILAFNDDVDQQANIDPIHLPDAHAQYQFLADEAREKIMLGHGVVSPILLGIKDNTGFGNNAEELRTASILMDNMVVTPFKNIMIDGLKEMLAFNGISLNLYFVTLQPIEFTEVDKIATKIKREEETGEKLSAQTPDVEDPSEISDEDKRLDDAMLAMFDKGESVSPFDVVQVDNLKDESGEEPEIDAPALKKKLQQLAKHYQLNSFNIFEEAGELFSVFVRLWPLDHDTKNDPSVRFWLRKMWNKWTYYTHPNQLPFNRAKFQMEIDMMLMALEQVLDTIRRKTILEERQRMYMAVKIDDRKRKDKRKNTYRRNRHKRSTMDTEDYYVRYRYVPVRNSPYSRRFCKWLEEFTARNKVFRKEDIMEMSIKGVNREHGHKGNNYSIFKYKGGVNCHHYWQRVIIAKRPEEVGGVLQRRIAEGTEADAIAPDKNKDKTTVETRPIDMPNRGHHPNYKPGQATGRGSLSPAVISVSPEDIPSDESLLTPEDLEFIDSLEGDNDLMRRALTRARSVAKWARDNGYEVDEAELIKKFKVDLENPISEGAESFVFDGPDGKVVKLQSLVPFDPQMDVGFEKSLDEMKVGNKLFPSTARQFHGIYENEAGSFMVITQDKVEGNHPEGIEGLRQIKFYLESLPGAKDVVMGRISTGNQVTLPYTDDDGVEWEVTISDLREKNFIIDENGKMHLIDFNIASMKRIN